MPIKFITNNDTTELYAAKVAFLDVFATWCGPCKAVAPIVEELAEEFDGRVEFFKSDSDENPELSKKLRVMSIPNMVLLKEGKVVSRQIGFQEADVLRAWIEENL